MKVKDKQRKLLDSVLARVGQDGWTKLAFANGVKASGLSVAEARRLFPNGISDIVTSFQAMIDDGMHAAIKGNRKFVAMRVRDKVTFALRARFEVLAPHREAVRRLLVWSVLPDNIRGSAEHLWQVADTIWIAAGDDSTDYNHYTKRILLIAVMKSTLAFWLNDTSRDFCETWEFLDRRIADVMMLGKGIGLIKTIGISDIASFVRSRMTA